MSQDNKPIQEPQKQPDIHPLQAILQIRMAVANIAEYIAAVEVVHNIDKTKVLPHFQNIDKLTNGLGIFLSKKFPVKKPNRAERRRLEKQQQKAVKSKA